MWLLVPYCSRVVTTESFHMCCQLHILGTEYLHLTFMSTKHPADPQSRQLCTNLQTTTATGFILRKLFFCDIHKRIPAAPDRWKSQGWPPTSSLYTQSAAPNFPQSHSREPVPKTDLLRDQDRMPQLLRFCADGGVMCYTCVVCSWCQILLSG